MIRTAHCLIPAFDLLFPLFLVNGRLENLVNGPVFFYLFSALPVAGRKTRQIGGYLGRLTGAPMMSAWVCIRKSLALAPPSTRSDVSEIPESASMAPSTSLT